MKRFSYLLLASLFGMIFTQAQILSKEEMEREFKENAQERQERINAYLAVHPDAMTPEDTEKHQHLYLADVVDGTPIYYGVFNQGSNITMGTDKLHSGGSLGLSLDGAGLNVGVWDGGRILNTHQEFSGNRVTNFISGALSSHATHVSGTIAAQGIVAQAKGIAPAAKIVGKTYQVNDVYSDMSSTISNTLFDMKFSNHSWGLQANGLPTYYFGKYNASSRSADLIANNNPYHIIVVAAGNDRNDSNLSQVSAKSGFDLLTSMTCAKNVLTVGAIFEVPTYTGPTSVEMTNFSNWGPTDDYRIKPDIVAKGLQVYSTFEQSNTDYGLNQGTSMACPAITGLCVLLQDHYNDVHGEYMLSSTLRALIAHTAREAGIFNGPDARFGWGLPNAVEAANVISNSVISGAPDSIKEEVLNGASTYQFTATGLEPLVVTLAWNDPAGANNGTAIDDTTPALVNNLNVLVKDSNNNSYFPWRLNTTNNLGAALNDGPNNVDNIEKVEIPGASGVYTVEVNATGNIIGNQTFSLIVSGAEEVLGVDDVISADEQFEIFPNPVKDVLNLRTLENLNGAKVTVINVDGGVSKITEVNNNQVDVASLEKGNYLLVIEKDDQRKVKTFIKL